MTFQLNDMIFAYNCFDRKPFYFIITATTSPSDRFVDFPGADFKAYVMWGSEWFKDCPVYVLKSGVIEIFSEGFITTNRFLCSCETKYTENMGRKKEHERTNKMFEFYKQGIYR